MTPLYYYRRLKGFLAFLGTLKNVERVCVCEAGDGTNQCPREMECYNRWLDEKERA